MDKLSITIWLTHRCNMRCVYCYEKNKDAAHMSMDTAKVVYSYIYKTLSDNKVKKCFISFHGGEPFLENSLITYFLEKFSIIKEVDFIYSVTTNGTLLNDDALHNLMKFNEVNISIDGNQKFQKLNRPMINGEDSSVLLRKNIDHIINNNIKFNARMTVVPSGIDVLEENIDYIYNLGVKSIICAIDYWNYRWINPMLEKYLLHVSKCKEKYLFDDNFKIYDIMASTYSMKGKCAGGIYNRIIDCDGSLYPCTVVCGKSEYRIGNIYNGINTDWNLRLESYNSCIDNKCMNCNNSNKCAARRCIFMKKISSNLFDNLCTIQKINTNQ